MFLTYYAPLCRYVWHYVKSSDVAEELVQDLFVRVWEMRQEWNPCGSLRAYLYKGARNRALDHLKAKKVRRRYEEEDLSEIADHISLEDELHGRDFLTDTLKAIEELPERCRLVYTLHRQDGMTYSEIASLLDVSVKTVESHMARALKILRRRLVQYLLLLTPILLSVGQF